MVSWEFTVFRNTDSNCLTFEREGKSWPITVNCSISEYSRSTLNSVIPFMADFASGSTYLQIYEKSFRYALSFSIKRFVSDN